MRQNDTTQRVLAVDDEPLILLCIARALEDCCAEVKTVGSAEEALEEITARHYDLCFLDIQLPGMNGLEAMERIRELSPGTRVAIMSGSHLDESMKRRIKENACAFIEKPFDLSQIRKIHMGKASRATGRRHREHS